MKNLQTQHLKLVKQKMFLLLFCTLCTLIGNAQTNTWQGGSSGGFTNGSNWSLHAPQAGDTLVFNGNTSVTGVSTVSIAQIKLTGTASVSLQSLTGAKHTLTLTSTTTALSIPTGCTLDLATGVAATDSMIVTISSTSTNTIAGNLILDSTGLGKYGNTVNFNAGVTTVTGTITNGGVIVSNATNLVFGTSSSNLGNYVFNRVDGTGNISFPTANYTNANVTIQGISGSTIGQYNNVPISMNSYTINCPNLTTGRVQVNGITSGNTVTIAKDFTITMGATSGSNLTTSANAYYFGANAVVNYSIGGNASITNAALQTSRSGWPNTFSVTGNLTLNNGALYMLTGNPTATYNGSSATLSGGIYNLTVNGNYSQSGSLSKVFLNDESTVGGTTNATNFNLAGNFTKTAGSFTFDASTTAGSSAALKFAGTGGQMLSTDVALTTSSNTFLEIANNGIAGNNTVTLGSSFTLGGLKLASGLCALGANNLILTNAANLFNYSSSSYIVTNGSGTLTINGVSSVGNTVFPIGTATSYAPLTFTGGTADANISIGVGSTFTHAVNTATKAVNLQWSILASAATQPNVTFQYNTADQGSVYSASNVVLGTYSGTAYSESGLLTVSGSNPFTVTQSFTTNLPTSTANLYGIGNVGTFFGPTINFNNITKNYGDAAFTVSATSNSGGAFTYTSSNSSIATISGTTTTIVGAGTDTLMAIQAANGSYTSASRMAVLTVNPIAPTIGSFSVMAQNYGAAPFTLTAPTSNSAGSFSYSSSNGSVATISGNTVTITGAGTTIITATQAAYGNYTTGSTTATFTVNPITPTIGSFSVAAQNYGAAPFTLTAPTSNSAGSFSYSSSNTSVATISGSTLTIVGVGTSTITATQAASGNFSSGSTAAPFTVNPIAPGAPTGVTATADYSSASVSFTPPSNNGGTTIAQYTVTSNPGNITASGSTSPVYITGLTGGTSYTFTVTATNSAGNGTASNASNSITALVGFLWTGTTSNDFTVSTNWKPNRVSPNNSDVLVFASNVTVSNVTTETISSLQLTNNDTVVLEAGSAATRLTINNTTNPGTPVLNIPTGCALHLGMGSAVADSLSIVFTGSNNCFIAGTLALDSNYTGAYGNSFYAANSTTTVTGTIIDGGNIVSTASSLVFGTSSSNLGNYVFNHVDGTVRVPFPTANYANANVTIQGFSGTTIGQVSLLPISMASLNINCPSLTTGRIQFYSLASGTTVNITHDFTLTMGATSSANLTTTNNSFYWAGSIVTNFNIGGSLTINHASLITSRLGYPSSWNVTGDMNVNNGGFYILQGTPTSGTLSGGVYNLTINGNYSQSGSLSKVYLNNESTAGGTTNTTNFIVNRDFTKTAGSFIFDASTTAGSSATLKFSGTGIQTLSTDVALSTSSNTYLEIANTGTAGSNTVTLGSSFTLGGLKLTSGLCALGSSNLVLTNLGNLSYSTGSYIITNGTGTLTFNSIPSVGNTVFPIGTATSYAPLTFTGGTAGANISVGVGSTFTHAVNTATKAVNLQWSILASAATQPNVTFQYNTADQGSVYSASNVVLGTYSGTAYSESGLLTVSGSNPFTVTQSFTTNLPTSTANLYGIGNVGTFFGPTINFNNITKNYGDAAFTVSATSNSGGAFTYTSSNSSIATISGTTTTIVGAGTDTLMAIQAANGSYTSASRMAVLTVNPIAPTIGSFSVMAQNYGAAPFTLTAPTSNSAGSFSYSSSNGSVATISGNTVTITGAGTTIITATQAAYGNYTTGSTTATFTVNPITPTIGSFSVAAQNYGAAPFTLTAPTSNSAGSFSYSSSNNSVATISGNTVTIIGAGASTITATQAANGNYSVGSTTATFTVNPIAPTISAFTVASQNYGAAPFTLTAPTSNSAGYFSYSSSNTSVATISGNTVTIVGAGTTTITATQTANGNYTVGSTTATFTVNQGPPTIGSFTVAAQNYGAAPFTLTAPTSNSAGAFSYGSSNPSVATISGNTVTIIGVGTTTITATQAAYGNYMIGTTTATFTVNPIAPTIGTFTIGTQNYSLSPITLTSPTSNSAGSFSYSSSNTAIATISGNTLTMVGIGTCTITTSQVAAGNYTSGTTTSSLTVSPTIPASPTSVSATADYSSANISFTPPSNNGGTPIIQYTVVSNPGNFTATGNLSPIHVAGLSVGTNYTFTVTATNSVGIGAASTASNSISPLSGYIWTGLTSKDFQVSTNWSPNRTTLSNSDILAFLSSDTIINVPTQTISKLQLSNNAKVVLRPASLAKKLTISNSPNTGTPALNIPSGCTLRLGMGSAATDSLSIVFVGTNTCSIAGTLALDSSYIGTYGNSFYTANSITTVTDTIINGGNISSTASTLIFSAGSSYIHNRVDATVQPFPNTSYTNANVTIQGFSGTTIGQFTLFPTSMSSLTISCPNLTTGRVQFNSLAYGTTVSIANDFNVTMGGTSSANLTTGNNSFYYGANSANFSIGGNLNINNAMVQMSRNGNPSTWIVTKNMTINNGGFYIIPGTPSSGTGQYSLTVNGDYTQSGSLSIVVLNNGTTYADTANFILKGNFVQTGGVFSGGTGINARAYLQFSGTTNQMFTNTAGKNNSGSGIDSINVVINNTSGVTFTSGSRMDVRNLFLNSGILNTSAANDTLIVWNTSNPATAISTTGTFSAALCVNGNLAIALPKSLSSPNTYTLPIGSNNGYYPVQINNPTTTSGSNAIVQASVSTTGAGGSGLFGAIQLNTNKYWTIYSLLNAGSLTNTSLSLSDTGIGTANSIAYSNNLADNNYNSLGGTVSGNTLTNGNSFSLAASPQYFGMATINYPTYTWIGGSSGNMNTATNWTPTRTISTSVDILQFNSSVNVNGVTTDTIAQLILSNNASVSLQAATGAPATLSIGYSNILGTDLNIPAGCSLRLATGQASTDTMNIGFRDGASANIAGTLIIDSTFTGIYNNAFYSANSIDTITGTIINGGVIVSTASTLIFGTSSSNLGNYVFNHTDAKASIVFPTANYTNANVTIQGVQGTTIPTYSSIPVSMASFTINCPNLTTGRVQFNSLASGNTVNIAHDFTITMGATSSSNLTNTANSFYYAGSIIGNFNIGGNLTIDSAMLLTARAGYPTNWTVTGKMNVNNGGFCLLSGSPSSGTVNGGSYSLTVNGNYSQSGNLSNVTLDNESNTTSNTTNFILKGDFIKTDGAFSAGLGTTAVSNIKFAGNTAQNLSVDNDLITNSSTTFEIANTGSAGNNTVTLGSSFYYNSILKLTSGHLVLNGNNLTLSNTATLLPSIPTSTSYIDASAGGGFTLNGVGNNATIFPVGTSTSYTPVTFSNTTNSPNITLWSVTKPNSTINGIVNLQWSIQSNVASTSNIAFQYNNADTGIGFTKTGAVLLNNAGNSYTKNNLSSINGTNPYIATVTSVIALPTAAPNYYMIGDTVAINSLGVPSAPIIGLATAVGGNNVSVSFSPPVVNTNLVDYYTVTSNPGGITAFGNVSPIIVTGLQNGTTYTFTVTASDIVGTGSSSAPSNAVTPGIRYYFSSSMGNDNNTIAQAQNPSTPWKTLDKLNSMMGILEPGNQVLFNCNDTFPGTIAITNSGTRGNPIVFSSYGIGKKPVFDGRLSLPTWKKVGTNLWEASSPSLLSMPSALYINDSMMALGRYPNINASNGGYLSISSNPNSSNNMFTCTALTGTPDFTGATACVRSEAWLMDRMPGVVENHDTITFSDPKTVAHHTPLLVNFGFFFQNHPNCLDVDGDWCYQSSNDSILLYATKNPSTRNVKVANTEASISDTGYSNIVIDGLSFIGAKTAAIGTKYVNYFTVTNCDFTKAGLNDLNFTDAYGNSPSIVTNFDSVTVTNNTFSNSQGYSVVGSGTRFKLTNNQWANVSMVIGMGESGFTGTAFHTSWSNGLLLQNNYINGTGYSGIVFDGSNVLVDRNYVTNFCNNLYDGGGIYSFDPGNDSAVNRVISNNIVTNGIGAPIGAFAGSSYDPACGIYLDDISSNVKVIGNTVANTPGPGYMSNGGSADTIINNTFYNCNLNINLRQVTTNYSNNSVLEALSNYSTKNDFENNTIVSYSMILKDNRSSGLMYDHEIDSSAYPAALGNYGTVNNNILCNPFRKNNLMDFWMLNPTTGNSASTYYNLPQWTALTGYDSSSKLSPVYFPLDSNRLSGNGISNGLFNVGTTGWTCTPASGNRDSMTVVSGVLSGNCLRLKSTGSNSTGQSTLKYSLPATTANGYYLVGMTVKGTKSSIINCTITNSIAQAVPINIDTSTSIQQFLFQVNAASSSPTLQITFDNTDSIFYLDSVYFYQVTPNNPANFVRFAINPTSKDSSIVADMNYITPSGVSYTLGSSVPIPSYGSVVLLKDTTVTNFYYAGTGSLNSLTSWGANTNGTGSHPSNFTSNNQLFMINNTGSLSLLGNWTVSGTGSAVVLGDGINPITMTIPSNYTITGTLNVANTATLINQNTVNPTFGFVSTGSTIIFNGATTQTIPAATYGNLTLNNVAGTTLGGNVTTTNLLTVSAGSLTTGTNNLVLGDSAIFAPATQLNINGGTTDFAGKSVKFQSSLAGTASLASLSGTLLNATNVTVERYVTAKTSRKYSYVGSPVVSSIQNGWQQQIYVTGAGVGGTPCGTTNGTGVLATDKFNSNGFDVTQTNNPSMYTYNATKVNGSRYVSVPNTNYTNLSPGTGYCVNIRGNRNSSTVNCTNQLASGTPSPPEAVTLSATGTLTTGDMTLALNDTTLHKYTLLANPYQSPISFKAVQMSNASRINNKMWTYSPFGNGNYTTYSQGVIANGATGYDNVYGDYIAIGQAFFVEANANGNIVFHESHKTNGTIPNTQYFGESTVDPLIRVGLRTPQDTLLDEIVVRFNKNGSPGYNENNDAVSFSSANEALVSLKGSKKLAIATHPLVVSADSIELGITNNSSEALRFSFTYQGFDTTQAITLIDNFLGLKQEIRSNPVYDFNITSNSASKGNTRFKVIIANITPLAVNPITVSVIPNIEGAMIKWSQKNQINLQSYIVERSTDNQLFTEIGKVAAGTDNSYSMEDNNLPVSADVLLYRIKAIANDGSYQYSTVTKLNINHTSKITIYPNPIKGDYANLIIDNLSIGNYKLCVYNSVGVKVAESGMNYDGSKGSYQLDLKSCVANGNYGVVIIRCSDNSIVDKKMVAILR